MDEKHGYSFVGIRHAKLAAYRIVPGIAEVLVRFVYAGID